ncbi:phosphoribosylglycinamide formyltransferase PurN [Phaeobacter piscinae]|uniref:Phosphoribosylglycinamide formyltransferase n=1 Tax=Phaeobacter piscinae TaxID=1580596 RepID=A0AAN1LA94_9RHOB|nr:phosphoribosylglycinamide formyltransferase [Phaeobacter piscinae]ATG43199.1 phosphoribosylglycinamide formyltransferase PurN [Phaeobacter piscinae]AUQ74576.1 phosphoribosylglycinamide formyltransferase PurN [Phaeobacter piscinae]AUR35517.1 phosphoribosylglycinamide formyltransferase PurN [Phaeobacter piscinae]
MSHKRVAILISGGGSNMVSLVDSMTGDHPARPCLVLSNIASAGGLTKAATAGIPTAVVDHKPYGKDRAAFEAELVKPILESGADIVCLAGFMRVLTDGFVSQFQGRMLNIHPSLLPKYTGLNTHARALEAGDHQHGCTVHEVTAVLDDGPILGQARVDVDAADTPETLAAKVLVKEHKLYPAVLRRYAAGDKTPVYLS